MNGWEILEGGNKKLLKYLPKSVCNIRQAVFMKFIDLVQLLGR